MWNGLEKSQALFSFMYLLIFIEAILIFNLGAFGNYINFQVWCEVTRIAGNKGEK